VSRRRPVAVLVAASLAVACGPIQVRSRIQQAKQALGRVDAAADAGGAVDPYHRLRAEAHLDEARRLLSRADHGWARRLAETARDSAREALADPPADGPVPVAEAPTPAPTPHRRLGKRADALAAEVEAARGEGARRCAPVELALAESHLTFAWIDLSLGELAHAEAHLALGEPNAAAARTFAQAPGCRQGLETAAAPGAGGGPQRAR